MKTLAKQRPKLSSNLASSEFLAWYWLKEEMVRFCKEQGISTLGSKPEIAARVEALLAGRPLPGRKVTTKKTRTMPSSFQPEMRIEAGWRCGPALGAYFRKTLGNGFRFNKAMRDFVHTQIGKTLLEAEQCYLLSIGPEQKKLSIPKQLEYNQHFRDYFTAHPRATRQEAIRAWWDIRNSRKF